MEKEFLNQKLQEGERENPRAVNIPEYNNAAITQQQVRVRQEMMLQRQQASAIIDARKMIVDGAVGMVEMALDRLNENKVVELDDERKAAMVSNLLVVLCGNRDAQPIVNSGSLY